MKKPPQTAALTSRGAFKVRGLPVRLRSAPRTQGLDSAELSKLPRLPDTAEEARSIALAVEADLTKDIFVGKRAIDQKVKSLDLSGYKIPAFATHGLIPVDLNGLTQPALALSSPEIGGTGGHGLLTMGEILGLKLDADWVVLSACNTAAGDGAEAFSGLGRAFFYAGTRALLRPVETTSARALKTDLFRRQAKNPALTRTQALRQAMLTRMDGRGFVDQTGRGLLLLSSDLLGTVLARRRRQWRKHGRKLKRRNLLVDRIKHLIPVRTSDIRDGAPNYGDSSV